jgi:hypothetical protein
VVHIRISSIIVVVDIIIFIIISISNSIRSSSCRGSTAAGGVPVALAAGLVLHRPGDHRCSQGRQVFDSLIGDEQLEYYTQQRVGILLHGLLVKAPNDLLKTAVVRGQQRSSRV